MAGEGRRAGGLLETFQAEVVERVCETPGPRAKGLVRKHDKELERNGDFSLPSLALEQVWARHGLRADAAGRLLWEGGVLPVARVVEGERAVAVHLHRPAVFRAYFLGGEAAAVGRAEPTDGLELDWPCSGGLTAARAASGRSCLARIRGSDPGAAALRVGPVLGQDGRKEELETVEQLEKRVGAAARLLDEARREEGEEDEVTETRLGRLARAAVQFAFLGGSLARPVRIDLTCQRSSFVLYNNARMRRLLAAFEQRVVAGTYPGLPAAKTIQFELLAEPEEWQLMFNYLLVADDVISECAASLSLHKLVQLVCGLASTYSRYYNRVKTLKDPLPGLVPLVHARVFLVREVNRVCERLLRLLGCQPLENM